MGVRSTDAESDVSALYDSVTGVAFGPTFTYPNEASDFLEWYANFEFNSADLRTLNEEQWNNLLDQWGMETL
jgi:hypothetical protein